MAEISLVPPDVDEAELAAHRARCWDTRCSALLAACRITGGPSLQRAGYFCRFDGRDGLGCWDNPKKGMRIIHSIELREGAHWGHVSLSRRDRVLPTWEQTRDAFRLIYPDRFGVVVIPPTEKHVDWGEVMHVWANLDKPAVPDFTWHGHI